MSLEATKEKGDVIFGSLSEGQKFTGMVLAADEVYVVQSLGRSAVLHDTTMLSEIPQVGKNATIKYDQKGQATVMVKEATIER